MSLFIQGFVVIYLAFPVLLWGNTGRNSLFQQAIPEPIRVIPPIRQKVFGGGEIGQQLSGTLIIRHLTCRQIDENRFA
jgi:hypothetical protein